jgi:hypothetical protein
MDHLTNTVNFQKFLHFHVKHVREDLDLHRQALDADPAKLYGFDRT